MHPGIDLVAFLERVGWLREQVGAVDRDAVRLGEDIRGGIVVDADDLKKRYVSLELQLDHRRDEVAIWRMYLYPPKSRTGRFLFALGEAALWLARRAG